MIVEVDMRKWVEQPHWRFTVELLGEDQYGTWLGGRPPTTYTGPRGNGAWQHAFVTLVPNDRWWIASFNERTLPDPEVYVDVTTVPHWPSSSRVTAIDLDLDVVRRRDGHIYLDDEDEFEEHQVRLGYPDKVIERALATARELMQCVERRREPFGSVALGWLEKLATT